MLDPSKTSPTKAKPHLYVVQPSMITAPPGLMDDPPDLVAHGRSMISIGAAPNKPEGGSWDQKATVDSDGGKSYVVVRHFDI
jgi:hypothetical protein